MADESNDRDSSSNNSDRDNVNYVRKKNLIPGIDNDHLILGGLGVLTAIGLAPYAKQLLDNVLRNLPQNQGQGQQLPPNGVQQQPVYLPPNPQQQVNLPPAEHHEHEHFHETENPLTQHEQGMKDQQAYEAAQEKEQVTAPASFNMVPDRSTQVSSKNINKNKGNYEAGSNISGSYS